MADVLTQYKLTVSLSEEERTDLLKKFKEEHSKNIGIEFLGGKEETGPFGITYITITILSPDSEEGSEAITKFEEVLEEIEEVQSWEQGIQTLASH
jgi:translation elongation factor EF-1beta